MTKEEVVLPATLVGGLLVLARLLIAFWPRKRPKQGDDEQDWTDSGAEGM